MAANATTPRARRHRAFEEQQVRELVRIHIAQREAVEASKHQWVQEILLHLPACCDVGSLSPRLDLTCRC